jgi:glycosyltransferase involved in cell wall biosynthesis
VDLVAQLESPLPASLPAGTATAVFCIGACFHRRERVVGLELVVDGSRRHRPAAFGMPRPDLGGAARRSGFWGTIPIRADAGAVEIAAAVRLAGGSEQVVPLARIEVVPRRPQPERPADPELIAICMATYEPDGALLGRQLESLRAQTHGRWVCVISDDCSSEQAWRRILDAVAGDPRFVVSRSEHRRGYYGNFERALTLAPPGAGLVALCDQDDVWRPEKLAVLREALGTAQLVYSDQRVVDADRRVLRDTLWRGRRRNHTNLASLLIANTIVGAATLFRREVAETALPFPDAPGLQFHDHWLALVALATGEIAYVDRPLYDYVQHQRSASGERPVRRARRLLRGGRGAYFLGYLGRDVLARTLLVRCAGRLSAHKRRALERYVAAARSPLALAWLAARPLRAAVGRNETLASEWDLVRGIAWRWAAPVVARWVDASFPDPTSFRQERLQRWRTGA